ncbi:DDE-type integrase/transposase/recombinase [Spirosoma aureum]|uniref:DDE-type integrase/transposase/recombinase n=1 Tax=Spirosoma aureum TaxID=2692134 RepID=A0A6G9AMK9_9BACT|nr:DDE-type integrase/transposase/recombinase [Spirosoma aureum]
MSIKAFDQPIELRQPKAGLIVHSDRGGQYFGHHFRKRLDKWQCKQSMAEADNPYQNAHAESFWVGPHRRSIKSRVVRRWLFYEPTRCSRGVV